MGLQRIHFVQCLASLLAASAQGGESPVVVSVSLEPIAETPDSRFLLSSGASDAVTAQHVCEHHGGNLLSISSSSELEILQTSLLSKSKDISLLWTSAVRHSNSSVDNLRVWSDNQEPFTYPLLGHEVGPLRKQFRKRSVEYDDTTDCPCPCPTPATVRPRPLCKRPQCNVTQPACEETTPRQCLISRPPICTAHEQNCTVDCGTPKDCVVLQQPSCRIKPSDRPNCRLDMSNVGRCTVFKPQNCTVVNPGECHALPVKCTQESKPCKPITRPCKNPCSERECVTVQPPCTTTQPDCVTTTTPCPPVQPPIPCFARCQRSFVDDKELRRNCKRACLNATDPTPPDCGQTTTICPPAVETCPPAVTSCTRPFVDCSPQFCQSTVHICNPPRMHCQPVQISCTSPVTSCDDPVVVCQGEPQVICQEPELECDKPILKCPDPVVHCQPVVTTCEPAPPICTDPAFECSEVQITCDDPTECEDVGGGGECNCPTRCNKRRSRRSAEVTECIAVTAGKEKADWLAQSCKEQHKFVCKIPA